MKTNKLFFGLAALILAFGLILGVSAFKTKTYVYWRYQENNASQIRVGTSYSLITSTEPEPCEDGDDLPCVLKVDASINTQAALHTYLQDNSIFPTEMSITNFALYKKAGE